MNRYKRKMKSKERDFFKRSYKQCTKVAKTPFKLTKVAKRYEDEHSLNIEFQYLGLSKVYKPGTFIRGYSEDYESTIKKYLKDGYLEVFSFKNMYTNEHIYILQYQELRTLLSKYPKYTKFSFRELEEHLSYLDCLLFEDENYILFKREKDIKNYDKYKRLENRVIKEKKYKHRKSRYGNYNKAKVKHLLRKITKYTEGTDNEQSLLTNSNRLCFQKEYWY